MEINKLFQRIQKGERSAIAEGVTLIENNNPKKIKYKNKLIELCIPESGDSYRIAVSGIPGVGKSTFINEISKKFIKQNKKIAILTIDPSSSKSGGSIMGDKTRMNDIMSSEQVFIRPSPNSGHLGGININTQDAIILFEAAGYKIIIIETVGVGQSEFEVKNITDLFILLTITNTGDEIQAIKKGIIEISDLILINKSDNDNIKKSQILQKNLKSILNTKQNTTIEICSSLKGDNISNIHKIIIDFFKEKTKTKEFIENRKNQKILWIEKKIKNQIIQDFYNKKEIKEKIKELYLKIEKNKFNFQNEINKIIKLYKS